MRERLQPDLVLLDIWMPDVDGITLLKEWGASGQLTMPVIMMSGHGTIDTAVEATKYGAMRLPGKADHAAEAAARGRAGAWRGPARRAAAGRAGSRPAALSLGGTMPPPRHGGSLRAAGTAAARARRPQQSFDLDRPLREARDAFEKSYFEFHLAQEGGSMTRVAEKTGLERTHLYRKLKQLGVDLSRNKRGAAEPALL